MSRDTLHWDLPARPEWYVQTGGMHENPHGVPLDEIVRMILTNPPEMVAQVVFGKYVESSGLVFSAELISRLFDRSLPVVNSNQWFDLERLEQSATYVKTHRRWMPWFYTGVDLARQTDYTVITTIDTQIRPARVVYWKRLNRVPWETVYHEIGHVRAMWGPNILVDSTGIGDVILDGLHDRLYCPLHRRCVLAANPVCSDRKGVPLGCDPGTFLPLTGCDGYHFSASTKKELIDHLRLILSVGYDPTRTSDDFGWLRCPPVSQLEEEMTFYAWDDKRLETDCLFSLALAAWAGLEDPVGQSVVGSVFGE